MPSAATSSRPSTGLPGLGAVCRTRTAVAGFADSQTTRACSQTKQAPFLATRAAFSLHSQSPSRVTETALWKVKPLLFHARFSWLPRYWCVCCACLHGYCGAPQKFSPTIPANILAQRCPGSYTQSSLRASKPATAVPGSWYRPWLEVIMVARAVAIAALGGKSRVSRMSMEVICDQTLHRLAVEASPTTADPHSAGVYNGIYVLYSSRTALKVECGMGFMSLLPDYACLVSDRNNSSQHILPTAVANACTGMFTAALFSRSNGTLTRQSFLHEQNGNGSPPVSFHWCNGCVLT